MGQSQDTQRDGAAKLHAHLLHMLGAASHEEAGGIIAKLHACQLALEQQGVPPEWHETMKDMVDAMRFYEMDVDGPAPEKHRAMMKRAKKLLATHPTQQGLDALTARRWEMVERHASKLDIEVPGPISFSWDWESKEKLVDVVDTAIAAQAKQGGV